MTLNPWSRREWLKAAGLALGIAMRPGAPAEAADSQGLSLNIDNTHFFLTRSGSPVSESTVNTFIDQYNGTRVKRLFLSPNSQRTSYRSEVWDPLWKGYQPDGPDDQPLLASTPPALRTNIRKVIHTAWAYDSKGIDVYSLWIARCRAYGIGPWLSVRMNDVHYNDDINSCTHSDFWRANPQFWRIQNTYTTWTDRALNYAIPEVRANMFRLLTELAGRYDFDGLELDWMRHPLNFPPGAERASSTALTSFIVDVRRLLDQWAQRRGHPISLGVRVPARPETAAGLGFDVATWAGARLVDHWVPSPLVSTSDGAIPIGRWKQMLANSTASLAGGIEISLKPYWSHPKSYVNDLLTVRGTAASLLGAGADSIYLFNYPDGSLPFTSYRQLLRDGDSLSRLLARERRYVVTFTDLWAPGEVPSYPLPLACEPGRASQVTVWVGPVSKSDTVTLRLSIPTLTWQDAQIWEVRVNDLPVLLRPCQQGECSLQPAPAGLFNYGVPASILKAGNNVISVFRPSSQLASRVEWIEFAVA